MRRGQSSAQGEFNRASDWSITTLGQLAEFITSGSRGWARYYADQGALFVRSQNVRAGRLNFTDMQHVVQPAGAEGNRTRVQQQDLLVTITGNSVGNVALVEQDLGEAYISQHVGLIRFQEPGVAFFVARYLAPGAPGNGQIAASQSGQSKPGLTLKNLHEFLVALPSVAEQRAIATALSDMDALLAGLDRLIAKKRDLKQAAMQHLLTGKTRLPGFSGEWHDFTLHDACIKIQDGTHFSPKMGGNDFPYITSKNVGFGRMELSQVEWISAAEHAKIYSRCNVRRGDLLLTKDGANTGNAAVNPFAEPISLLSSVAFCGLTKTGTVPTFFFTRYCPPKANARSSGK